MVVKRRLRRFLMPLALYCASGAVVAYFVHHANNGHRGLEAKRALKIQAYELNRDLEAAKVERQEWERRIALLRSDQIDRDLLEEQARIMLGRVHRNDLVIITGP
ncbi:MAG TPA: septum formation initiator family protein [Beijerinckiaceae bacterium]|jgi:cell division protein FtsB